MTLGDVLVSVFRRSRWRRSKYNIQGIFADSEIKCLSMTDLSQNQVLSKNTFVSSHSEENLLASSHDTYCRGRGSRGTEFYTKASQSRSPLYKKRPQSCFIDYGVMKADFFKSSLNTDNDHESMDRSTDSVLSLTRKSSIQDKSLKIMRRRHQNVKKRSRDSQRLSDCDIEEGYLIRPHEEQIVKQENRRSVHFDDLDSAERKATKILSVSTTSLCRNNSVQLKSWQIRRQRRAMLNKHKRASRLLMWQENVKYEERLV